VQRVAFTDRLKTVEPGARTVRHKLPKERSMKPTFAVVLAAATFATPQANAQQAAGSNELSIAEIMTLQQTRHIKLWFAGRAGNWPLADYELDQLKDGFDDVDQRLGGGTVEKAVGAGIAAVEKAVAGKDRAGFADAFDRLSAGCNSCHRTLDHAFVVIQRPTLLPYSDQSFAVPK
jgi:hypothetical protein